jgi:hypothetical protein
MFCLLFGASTRLVVVLLIAFCPIFFLAGYANKTGQKSKVLVR